MRRSLAVVDDDGEGATGDHNGNGVMGDDDDCEGATGNGTTGYDNNDDDNWRHQQLQWHQRDR